jgi:hypothetical protein
LYCTPLSVRGPLLHASLDAGSGAKDRGAGEKSLDPPPPLPLELVHSASSLSFSDALELIGINSTRPSAFTTGPLSDGCQSLQSVSSLAYAACLSSTRSAGFLTSGIMKYPCLLSRAQKKRQNLYRLLLVLHPLALPAQCELQCESSANCSANCSANQVPRRRCRSECD